jgi:hypothetical protein
VSLCEETLARYSLETVPQRCLTMLLLPLLLLLLLLLPLLLLCPLP